MEQEIWRTEEEWAEHAKQMRLAYAKTYEENRGRWLLIAGVDREKPRHMQGLSLKPTVWVNMGNNITKATFFDTREQAVAFLEKHQLNKHCGYNLYPKQIQ